MKYLSQFVKFDWSAFAQGKQFLVTGCSQWVDRNSDELLGTRVEVAIVKDSTHYQHREGESGSNLFEKLIFKVSKEISVPENSLVIPAGEILCTVYGEYRNQLSVKVEDIKVLQASKQ